jgi:hypothetical protein
MIASEAAAVVGERRAGQQHGGRGTDEGAGSNRSHS